MLCQEALLRLFAFGDISDASANENVARGRHPHQTYLTGELFSHRVEMGPLKDRFSPLHGVPYLLQY